MGDADVVATFGLVSFAAGIGCFVAVHDLDSFGANCCHLTANCAPCCLFSFGAGRLQTKSKLVFGSSWFVSSALIFRSYLDTDFGRACLAIL